MHSALSFVSGTRATVEAQIKAVEQQIADVRTQLGSGHDTRLEGVEPVRRATEGEEPLTREGARVEPAEEMRRSGEQHRSAGEGRTEDAGASAPEEHHVEPVDKAR